MSHFPIGYIPYILWFYQKEPNWKEILPLSRVLFNGVQDSNSFGHRITLAFCLFVRHVWMYIFGFFFILVPNAMWIYSGFCSWFYNIEWWLQKRNKNDGNLKCIAKEFAHNREFLTHNQPKLRIHTHNNEKQNTN